MVDSNRNGNKRGSGFKGAFDPQWKWGTEVHGDMSVDQPRYEDAFGNLIALGTTNEADLGSHYSFSPERYRLYVDDVRQQVQYDNAPAGFTDNSDSFSLVPQAEGETYRLETAERFRYVVQYITEWSLAFQINNGPLNEGDVWACGFGEADLANSGDDTPGPDATGWLIYQNSSHAVDEATLAEYRNGTALDTQDITFNELPDVWGRIAGRTNWYNVGETNLTETYTETDTAGITQQRNELVGTVANDDGKGPDQANNHISAEIKVGAESAGSLEFELGSIGCRTLGNVTAITRLKTFSYSESVDTVDVWQPVLAIREDPNRNNINVQFNKLNILEFTGNDDAFALINAFDNDNVRDSGGNLLQDSNYVTAPELSETGSVIEINTNVDQVADSTGTLQSTMANPGGYQLGFASRYASGQGSSTVRSASEALDQKRNLADGDVGVLLVKSPSTGTMKGQISTEQDW